MPENFKIVLPSKLYRSGQIAPSEIKQLAENPLFVRKIVSLDQNAGTIIAPYIPKGLIHIMFPLLESNGSIEARKLASSIKTGLLEINSGAVLVHCRRGIDRAGLAIAMYRVIKQGWSCTQAIEEAKSQGYGTGLSANTLGQYNIEICRVCTVNHTHYSQTVAPNTSPTTTTTTTTTDTAQADDIVSEMKDNFSHQDGWSSVGAIPTGTSTEYSFAPLSDSSVELPFGSKSSSVKSRTSLLKKLIKLLEEKNEDDNSAAMLPNSGLIDNYKGLAADQFGAPSSSPGSPNAANYVDPGGLVQL